MSDLNRPMTPAQWGLLGILSLLWGSSFFWAELALVSLPPLTLVQGRVTLGALFLLVVVRMRGVPLPRTWRDWRPLFVLGAFNSAIPFTLLFWGQTQITSGLAAILNASTPLWSVLLAHVFSSDETITPLRLGGVLVGVCGVGTIIGPEAFSGVDATVWAQLACVLAAVCYAATTIYARTLKGRIAPTAMATGQLGCGALLLLPVTLLVDQPWTLQGVHLTSIGAVVALALLSTAVAYTIYFRLLSETGPTNVVLVTFLVPITALLLGSLVLGEVLLVRHIGGLALIAVGLAAIDGRLPMRLLGHVPAAR
jgi:drug/metabolite transporter (DMT)-like permease